MPVTAIVGANWGDEGKGKITDLLAQNADYVVRFQGGANAGHTIINQYFSGRCKRRPHDHQSVWAFFPSSAPFRYLFSAYHEHYRQRRCL